MSCPLLETPIPSSTFARSLPTSVPPLRPHDQSWLSDDIPSFIPAGRNSRCQMLPVLKSEDTSSDSKSKFFLMSPAAGGNDQPTRVVRLRMRPSKRPANKIQGEMSTPSTTTMAVTNTAPRSHHVVTPERTALDASSFVNSESRCLAVNAADHLSLPSLADKSSNGPGTGIGIVPKRRKMLRRNSSYTALCA